MGYIWYLDSGALFHMTGNRDLFSDLEEKDLQQNIEFGDDDRYITTEIGIVTFQRENGSHLRLVDVFHVSGLRKNLVSIVLEERDYEVMFRKGKVFLKHIATRQVKHIYVRFKNLYALEVDDA